MKEKFLIEKTKLLTECLRGFFVLFVLDNTAIATLLLRQKFFTNNFEYNLLFTAVTIFIIILAIMIIFYKSINQKINLLK